MRWLGAGIGLLVMEVGAFNVAPRASRPQVASSPRSVVGGTSHRRHPTRRIEVTRQGRYVCVHLALAFAIQPSAAAAAAVGCANGGGSGWCWQVCAVYSSRHSSVVWAKTWL